MGIFAGGVFLQLNPPLQTLSVVRPSISGDGLEAGNFDIPTLESTLDPTVVTPEEGGSIPIPESTLDPTVVTPEDEVSIPIPKPTPTPTPTTTPNDNEPQEPFFTVVDSPNSREAAIERAHEINQSHPDLNAQVFEPWPGTSNWSVMLASREEAERACRIAKERGIQSAPYIWTFQVRFIPC